MTATAASPGSWAEGTQLTTVNLGSGLFSLLVESSGAREVWPELSLDATDVQFYGTVINDPVRGSQTVNLSGPASATVGTGTVTLSGGADGLAGLQFEHFIGDNHPWGLAALDGVAEVGLVAIPDAVNHPATAAAGNCRRNSASTRPTRCTTPCSSAARATAGSRCSTSPPPRTCPLTPSPGHKCCSKARQRPRSAA